MRYLLIVNPTSGTGHNQAKIDHVLKYFRHHGHQIDLRLTSGPGDAQRLAAAALGAHYDVVIGAGGDGTINEVINGLAGSPLRLAILPWGTGNVFAGEMGFPRRIKGLCRMIRRNASLRLDTGSCNGRHFLLMAGLGFDAYSLKLLKGQDLKKSFGVLAYALSAVRAIFRYRFPALSVTLADGRRLQGSFVLVSNTSRYGSFFSFTPGADPCDGLLDVFVLRQSGAWDTILLSIRSLLVFTGQFRRFKGLLHPRHSYRTSGLRIEGSPTIRVQLDGELADALPADLSVHPGILEIILPRRTIRRLKNG